MTCCSVCNLQRNVYRIVIFAVRDDHNNTRLCDEEGPNHNFNIVVLIFDFEVGAVTRGCVL